MVFALPKAQILPGVAAMMTEDPDFAFSSRPMRGWTDAVDTVPWRRSMTFRFRDRRVLGEYACWVGDDVGFVVAAESEEIADEALRLIEVDWEVLPLCPRLH